MHFNLFLSFISVKQLFLVSLCFSVKEKVVDWFGFIFMFSNSWLEMIRELYKEVHESLYIVSFVITELLGGDLLWQIQQESHTTEFYIVL